MRVFFHSVTLLLPLLLEGCVEIIKLINYFNYSSRVGHLILRTLAIRASDPQNALARTSFHSPKSLPPSPYSCFIPTILVIFYSFDWSQVAFGAFSFFFSSTTLETPEIHFHIFLFCTRSVYGRTRNDQTAGKVRKTIRLKCRQARSWPRIISSMKSSI